MNSPSSLYDPKDKIFVKCDKCRQLFREFQGVVTWTERHPSRRLLCILCDPPALEPALVGVTLAGWAKPD